MRKLALLLFLLIINVSFIHADTQSGLLTSETPSTQNVTEVKTDTASTATIKTTDTLMPETTKKDFDVEVTLKITPPEQPGDAPKLDFKQVAQEKNINLQGVTDLDVSDLGLTSITLPNLPALMHLNLKDNKLTNLTISASQFPKLKDLDLSGNPLSDEAHKNIKNSVPQECEVVFDETAEDDPAVATTTTPTSTAIEVTPTTTEATGTAATSSAPSATPAATTSAIETTPTVTATPSGPDIYGQ